MSLLPDEIRPVLDNGIPVLLATCSKDGVPNASIVSQVKWVDGDTVALSFQFFNKTIRNVRENPHAVILLNDLEKSRQWRLEVRYERSETEGPVFDAMDLEIEAIASATGMAGIFKLRSADLYRVLRVDVVGGSP
jgi:hypothetical protein